MPSFNPQANSTPIRGHRRQQIVIPPGLVDPNNTTVVEIPPGLHDTPTVVARRSKSGAVPLTVHHHRHRTKQTEMPSSPCEAAGGPVITSSTTSIQSTTRIIERDDSATHKSRSTRRTSRSPCRCRNRSRCPTLTDNLELSEERERRRLEHDLIAFQNARRRLIMNITQIGNESLSTNHGNESLSPTRTTNTYIRRSRSYIDQPTSILEEIETIEDIDSVSEDTGITSPLGPLYSNWNASPASRSSSSATRYERSLNFPGNRSLNYSTNARGQTPPSWVQRQYQDWETHCVPRRSPCPPRYGRSLSYSRSRSLGYPGRGLPPDLSQTPPSWVRRQPLSQTRYSGSVSYSDEDGINTQTYTVDSQLVLPPAPPRRSPRCSCIKKPPRRVLSETRIIEQELVKSPGCPSSRRNINSETFVVETESSDIPKRPILRSDTYSVEREVLPRSNMLTRTIKSESSILEYDDDDDDDSITPPIEYAPDSPYYQTSRTVIIGPNVTKSSCRTQPGTWRYSTQIGSPVSPHFSGMSSIAVNEASRSGINGRTYNVSSSNKTYNISNPSPRIEESFHRSQTVIIDPSVTRNNPPSGRRRRCPCAKNQTRPGSTSWRTSTQRDQTALPNFSGISSIGANATSRSGINGRTFNVSTLSRSGANGRTYNISNLNRSSANQRTYNLSNASRAGQTNRSRLITSISGVAPIDNQSNPSEYSREMYRLVSETSIKN